MYLLAIAMYITYRATHIFFCTEFVKYASRSIYGLAYRYVSINHCSILAIMDSNFTQFFWMTLLVRCRQMMRVECSNIW